MFANAPRLSFYHFTPFKRNLKKKRIMDFDTALIAEVKKHPELYDNSHIGFKNKELKQHVWAEIAYKVRGHRDEDDVKAVRNRWKSLRDSFVKEIKHKMALGAGQNVRNKKDWRYAGAMSFLAPFLAVTFRGFSDFDLENDDTTAYYNGEGHFMAPLLNGRLEEYRQEIDENDDIYSFFRGVADTVRCLKPINRVKIQRDIVNLVLDAKLSEIQGNNNNFVQ